MTPSSSPVPGEVRTSPGNLAGNRGRPTAILEVSNRGTRPIQVGSHFHFFEVNRALHFDRARALGMRLDIPSGKTVRWEPGETKRVPLVALGGHGRVRGHNRLLEGSARDPAARQRALKNIERFLQT